MARITRLKVLEAFQILPDGCATTTFRIAQRLGCSEYQVRATISWLVMGGQLIEYREKNVRKDYQGRKYTVKRYMMTGENEIYRVPRDPTDRKMASEARHAAKVTEILSRPW